MPAYPSKVDYVWTALDALNAQKDVAKPAVGDMVSPYGVPPAKLPDGGKKYAAGDKIPLTLSLRNQGFPWRLDWRFPKDGTLEWVDVPKEVTGFTTVGQLCAALFKFSPNRFPAKFYDLQGEGKKGNVNPGGWDTAPNMIFDYWGNSQWRYEQSIREGKFSWDQDKASVEIPEGTKLKVLAVAPVKATVPAGPGFITTMAPDELLKELGKDVDLILRDLVRAQDLLEKSEAVMKERMKFIHGVNALKATFWACSTDSLDPGAEFAAGHYAKASACVKKAKKMAKELPMKEFLAPPRGANATPIEPWLEEHMRKMLGQTDDMAKELKALAQKLESKLTFDAFFGARCAQFAKDRLEKKLVDDAVWQQMHDRLSTVMCMAFTMLSEIDDGDSLGEKLFALHATMPKKPAASAAQLSTNTSNPAQVVLSMVGNTVANLSELVIPTTFLLVGNLAGPPSLSIAIVQAAASSSLPKAAAQTSAAAGSGVMSALGEKVLAALDQHFDESDDTRKLATKIRAAFKANDQDALFDLKKEYGETIAGGKQVSVKWKSGIAVLQIISAILSIRECFFSKKEVKFVDYLGTGIATIQAGVATVETICTALGAWRSGTTVYKAISGAGLWLGRLSSVLGIILGAIAFAQAAEKSDGVGMFVACTQIFGNFFMLMGLLTTSIPGLQLVGLVIMASGVVVQIVVAITSGEEFNPNNANKVASQVFAFLSANPFYDLCCAHDPEFKAAMQELSEAASGKYLPYARNMITVHEQLEQHGFGREEIKLLVNTPSPPIDVLFKGAFIPYEI